MVTLTDVNGVSESRADNLRDEDFTSVDDIANADPLDLEEVHGIGPSTAASLIESAQDILREEHLDEEEEEEEEDEDREEVSLEDVEEINDEPPEDYAEGEPETPEEPETLDEEDDEEDEELAESYEVEFEVPSDEHYDYFFKALVDSELERSSSNVEQHRALQDFIESVRPLGGAGSVEVLATSFELNTLHAAVQQAESRHQQNRETDAFEALRDMKAQVNEARDEYIF